MFYHIEYVNKAFLIDFWIEKRYNLDLVHGFKDIIEFFVDK